MQMVIDLSRRTLEVTLWLGAPLLVVTMIVSLAINIIQVLTSVQEQTVSTVPRLAVTAACVFALMPWMFRQLTSFTTQILSDFRPFVR